MRILAVDSSAVAAGAAILEDGKIISEAFVNIGLTHSQTLLPLVQGALQSASLSLREMDCLAVAAGPGSFTGIRIGVAAVKGLAFADAKPCYAVSTLEGMAWQLSAPGMLVCPVMDARCMQVYAALFRQQEGTPVRLRPDAAVTLAQLAEQLESLQEPVLLVGDGADITYAFLTKRGLPATVAAAAQKYQHAAGVACAAYAAFLRGEKPMDAENLVPAYLRLSQAERELLNKNNKE